MKFVVWKERCAIWSRGFKRVSFVRKVLRRTPKIGQEKALRSWREVGRGILQRGHELKPWNIVRRYLVGKNAKRIAEDIAKLRHEGKSITITCPANPRSMGSLSHEQTMVFKSRRRLEHDIMESLKDNHVSIITICGVEGVGKTTMAQTIEDRVRSEKLFDEVVPVVVGQQIDMLKIQKEMAEILGLKLREEFLVGRADKIRTRLLDKNRKLVYSTMFGKKASSQRI